MRVMKVWPESGSAERTALALEVLQRSGFLRLQLQGASMLPTLWPGDVAEIAGCSLAEVNAGEIVLALRDGHFFLHRLVSCSDKDGVVIRGDAMPRPDSAASAVAIVGRVARITRAGKIVSLSTRLPTLRRAFGILFCYCGRARRVALRLHARRIAEVRSQIAEVDPGIPDSNGVPLCNLTSDLYNRGEAP
jgi:hypothetical protein